MRWPDKTPLIIIFLLLTGCASKGELEFLQRDQEELKAQLFRVEKDLGGIRSEAKEGLEKNLKNFQKEVDAIRKGTADLQATLDSAKVDMQVLTGKVDDVTLLAKKPAEDITLFKEDSIKRFSTIEERLLKLEGSLDELQKKVAETKTKELEQAPDALYQKGLDLFRGGDPLKSREQLSKFLELYPTHELTANAHYWLGETYYSEKKYDQAILEFQEVIKNFPGKEKVPAAMLKQAMAFKELGDAKSARYVYKKLLEDFPYADEAKLAKERLRELK